MAEPVLPESSEPGAAPESAAREDGSPVPPVSPASTHTVPRHETRTPEGSPHAVSRSAVPRYGRIVAITAAVLGLAAAVWLSANDLMNVAGDGIAHLNIARKVVDAAPGTPLWSRYAQLGSPWLPVQHVSMLPLVWIDPLWRSGWAGAIPSLAAFVVAAWATYRLAFDVFDGDGDRVREPAALLAAGVVALNPSTLFLAATPMTELPFLAALVTSAWTLDRWAREPGPGRLAASALCIAVATLTRYEGWALVPAGAIAVAVAARGGRASLVRDAIAWTLLAASGIAFWLWHNHAVAGDPLAFVRGPYSARAVFERADLGWAAVSTGQPGRSLGWALLTVAVVVGPLTVALAIAGGGARVLARGRSPDRWRSLARDLPAALLVVPFAFLAFSLYRGEVQIAPLAAVALLNVRYGVPHIAALGLLVAALGARFGARRAFVPALAGLVLLQNLWLVSEGFSHLAVCQEPIRNNRNAAEWRERYDLAAWLAAHPPPGRVLLHSGDLGPVVPRSGLTFARVVHDGSVAWGEWVASSALPGDVSTVVFRSGDEVHTRLGSDPGFATAFQLAHRAGPFEIWTRR